VSAALLGLAEAALSYDATRNTRFWTFARYRINGAMIDAARKYILCGYRPGRNPGGPQYIPCQVYCGQFDDPRTMSEYKVPDYNMLELGWEIEYEDEVEAACKKLRPQARRVFRFLFLYGKNQSEVSQILNVSQSRISDLVDEIKRDLSPYGATP
jgi:RNA polymerase sigma factor (sigma-70 family)